MSEEEKNQVLETVDILTPAVIAYLQSAQDYQLSLAVLEAP